MVIFLTTFVVTIAYWIGLPHWWSTNKPFTIFLFVFGNWLLMNVIFHYYMGVTTPPGFPATVYNYFILLSYYKIHVMVQISQLYLIKLIN